MNTPAPTIAPTPALTIPGTHCRGFTMIELMVTVALLAILLGIAAPSVRETIMNARMTAQTNDLMADLVLARSEAVKRGVGVFLCPSPSPHTNCGGTAWTDGWMVFPDADGDSLWDNDTTEPPIKSREAAQTGTTITVCGATTTSGISYVPYRPTGVSNAAGTPVTFVMCDGRTTEKRGRRIVINATGRPVVSPVTCPFLC